MGVIPTYAHHFTLHIILFSNTDKNKSISKQDTRTRPKIKIKAGKIILYQN
jgi:hypothetical protein